METNLTAIPYQGLDESEAAARLRINGPNELPSRQARSLLLTVFNVAREPMMVLLLAAGLIYLALGDRVEALILLIFASISVLITVVQETRTEHVLEALRDLTSPRALVIRSGIRKRIAGRDVVKGDIIALQEGSRVPADGSLIEFQDLLVDESLLTGESIAVEKSATSQEIYSGTLVVRGTGLARVTATGGSSRIGQIGSSLNAMKGEPPRLLAETQRLVRLFGTGAAIICTTAAVLYGFLRSDWINGILAGIALAMSMLPEEFPVVLTVFTAMGAWRISQARVLTRRAATIESLGAATVLCTDKTGTLTENRMSIVAVQSPDSRLWNPLKALETPSEEMRQLVSLGRLASDCQPYDPMELAFHQLAVRAVSGSFDKQLQLVRTYGLQPGLMAMTQVWRLPDGASLLAATKGAPEAVATLCQMDEVARVRLLAAANAMAKDGLRVLAIASADLPSIDLPVSHLGLPLIFKGLVGLADPLRAAVPAAISEARAAGIRVVMITGDSPVTARAIGQEAGLESVSVLTGEELSSMNEQTLSEAVRSTSIFARTAPDQKLRIVNALKGNGQIVAMTGDGVNDAPSLKAAHIGIAMGRRGTDVAREAASLVLLDDDFGAIIEAIRLGRRIHDNLRKAMCFIIAVHVPIAGLALLPLVFGMPVILTPLHIALLELVIDPVCSLVFENEREENHIMRRPPASPNAPLISFPLLAWGAIQGLVVVSLVISAILFKPSSSAAEMAGYAFLCLVLLLLALTVTNRSFTTFSAASLHSNSAFTAVVGVVVFALGVIFLWPQALRVLSFVPLGLSDIFSAAVLAVMGTVILEGLKTFWRKALTA